MKVFLFKFLIFFWLTQTYAQTLQRVEPPFWWSGMTDSTLQILCYGKHISDYKVQLSEGKLISQTTTENPDYLFINIDTKDMKPGVFKLIFKKNGQQKFVYNYELKKRCPGSKYRQGFDTSDVIYLIMSDRFANGNPANDSDKSMRESANRSFDGGRHGGDIQGIVQHLDYLQDLGVTTLWPTPMLKDNESRFSYHGYAISDFYKVDPRFGSNETYKNLAAALHKRQMKLIMDFVINHWGSKHWMFNNWPQKDWIHIWPKGENGFQRSNYRMTTQFDPHATKTDAQACMDGWFDTTMPDMNLANPLLKKYVIQNAIWWIEYADLDGLRVDTYSYNDKYAIADWTKAVLNEYPNLNIVGEVWMHNQAQIAYWQKDSPVGAIQHYNSYLPTLMDFTLHDALKVMFDEDEEGWDKGVYRAYDNFTNDFLYENPNNLLVFAGNHDTNRINEIYKGDLSKYKLAMTLILTVRGMPQLYYGDEIGMRGNKALKGDGDIRRDFPGGWSDDSQNAFKDSSRTPKQKAYFDFTRKLLQWRKHKSVVHSGEMIHFIPKNNLYVYFRVNKTDKVMVIINNAAKKNMVNPDDYQEVLKQHKNGFDIVSEKNIDLSKSFELAPKSSMIIEVKN